MHHDDLYNETVTPTLPQICLLMDDTVSRKHAVIRFHDDAYYLIDLGSSNGSSINQVAASSWVGVRLSAGDDIEIGATTFLCCETDERCAPLLQGPPCS